MSNAEAGYAKNASGMWEKDGKPLSAVIEAISILNAIGPVVAQQLKNAGIDAELPLDAREPGHHARRQIRPRLFGHRGSISDPYATMEIYHSRNAFEIGRPTLLPARVVQRRVRQDRR